MFLLIGALFYDWVVMGDVQERRFGLREEMLSTIRSAAFFIQTTSYAATASVLLTYILFFVWIYRASTNAHAMGADLSNSAGFSVGMFFIPLANIFLPPIMMSELTRAAVNAPFWRGQARSPIVPLWWTLQLVASLGGIVIKLSLPSHEGSISAIRTSFQWLLLIQSLGVLHYFVMGLLVRKVTDDQRRQWEKMEFAETIFS